MKLTVRNMAKIVLAEFELNGITVIAGNNDTGKSTIGKAVFALFSALSNLEDRIKSTRKQGIRKILRTRGFWLEPSLIEGFLSAQMSDEDVLLKMEVYRSLSDETSIEEKEKCLEEMRKIRGLPDEQLRSSVISRHLSDVFAGQYLPLGQPDVRMDVELLVKGKAVCVRASGEDVQYQAEVRLFHTAHYIEDPKVLEHLNAPRILVDDELAPFLLPRDAREQSLLQAIRFHTKRDSSEEPDVNALEDALTENRLKEVFDVLASVLPGKVVLNKQKRYVFKDSRLDAEVELPNLSMGMKVFALLQLLLGTGTLQREDVLILDEPEVHLHPDWQLVYAEMVVLLQKHFDLTILLTSHSSDFIDALQLFAHRHHIDDRVNAYISVPYKSQERSGVSFRLVDGSNWDRLYEKFLPALNRLRELRNME